MKVLIFDTLDKGALLDTILFRLWSKEGEKKYIRNSVNIGDSVNEMLLQVNLWPFEVININLTWA